MKVLDLPYDGKVNMYDWKEGVGIIKEICQNGETYQKGTPFFNNVIHYKDAICSFDIETSKVENINWKEGEPEIYRHFSYPYCWQFMINDKFIFGRKPEDFFKMLDKCMGIGTVVIWIHNIVFEYNNLADFFTKHKAEVFFKNGSTPLYIKYRNFEFRCSAQLTHKSLAMLGEEIDYKKLKGDLDYSIPRNEDTELTPEEMNYNYRDVAILNKWLEKETLNYTGTRFTAKLPYTQTGYVRNSMKKGFSKTPLGKSILQETCLDEETYIEFQKAFYGGYTHANFRHIGELFPEIDHFDITSAYPWAMVTQSFPYSMSKVNRLDVRVYLDYLDNPKMAQIARICFHGLQLKKGHIPYAPYNANYKQTVSSDVVHENGRVLLADEYIATLCDVDVKLILENYDYEEIILLELWRGSKRPLPTAVVNIIIDYFVGKTTLKGVEGKEYEYGLAKQMLNGIYGLAAQALIHDSYMINSNLETVISGKEYEQSKVLPYQWAIYITAYVRNVIYGMIAKLPDYSLFLYSDTDSIFTKKDDRVRAMVEDYNKMIKEQLFELQKGYPNIMPKNPKGKVQYLGTLLDEEDDCVGFMTIGAKRYFIKHSDGTYDLTVSGLRATKSWWDLDEDGNRTVDSQHHNGYNTDRLIKMFGSVEDAFIAIANGEKCVLPYVEGVDKLSNYNTRYDYKGILCGKEVERPCSFLLYPVATSLSLNSSILSVLNRIAEGRSEDVVYNEIY